jgi:Pentapeptide repeats (9 copies)
MLSSRFIPQCFNCKHFDNSCAAFPEGIPSEIMLNHFIHSKPYPGQAFPATLYDAIEDMEIIPAPAEGTVPKIETCLYPTFPRCAERPYSDTGYCTLHTDFPKEDDPKYLTIRQKKIERVRERIVARNFRFAGTRVYEIRASGLQDIKELNFDKAVIKGDIYFDEATVEGNATFKGVRIEGSAWFEKVRIKGSAYFEGATFCGRARFSEATIDTNADFKNTKMKSLAGFGASTVGNYLEFQGDSEIEGPANFIMATVGASAIFDGITIKQDCYFERVTIGEHCYFADADIRNDLRLSLLDVKGELSFRNTHFSLPEVEEKACRMAKQNCEQRGARQDADYYFYREMVARRKKQKERRLYRFPEWFFADWLLKYGTSVKTLARTWILAAFLLGLLTFVVAGLSANSWQWENIGFGFAAAFAPGFALAQPHAGAVLSFAIIEAMVSAFLWGAFILVFSRKYMR